MGAYARSGADGAAVAVSPDQVVGADGLDLTGGDVAQPRGDPLGILVEILQTSGEADLCAEPDCPVGEDRFHPLLAGHREAAGREVGEVHDVLDDRVQRPVENTLGDRDVQPDFIRSLVRIMTDHPGTAQLAIATTVPTGPNALRIAEGMLGILLSGGLPDRVTALAGDLIATYTSALALEATAWANAAPGPAALEQRARQVRAYFAALPADMFPHTVALAGPLTEGSSKERFEFGLEVLIAGLERISETS